MKGSTRCIVILSSSERENWDKAKKKEDKQLNYINKYARSHNLEPMEIVRRGCFGQYEMNRIFANNIAKLKAGKAEAILVANVLSIADGVADAYLKAGKVAEAGFELITVDDGKLLFDIYDSGKNEVRENED